ncbi:MAG TPA: serine hydrolase domain-containing protein, partial [Vicinamibacterales bacterium]|nr:serine hydrolase domain-containing protein [Vicinamibacterales bacterium]
MKRLHLLAVFIVCLGLTVTGQTPTSQVPTLAARLATLRTDAKLPAVAGATFSSTAISDVTAIGVRRLGDETPVAAGDLWHIGSITKSFTSLLIARHVERGEMSWTSTLGELFGAARAGKFAPVTLSQLLSHRAGLPANVPPAVMVAANQGAPSVDALRQRIVDEVLAGEPAAAPGAAFVYSNLGYIIAGAMLEAKTKKTWDELIREEVLSPLKLTSAGMGAPGSRDVVSQPRGHVRAADGTLRPVEPGPMSDNPPYLGPAGRLHMTVGDLARWGQAHLRGERGQDGIVRADTFKRLHQPEGSATYAMGWVSRPAPSAVEGPTPTGRILWHNGSNTMWYAIVAFDAAADRGVVIVTNGSMGAA